LNWAIAYTLAESALLAFVAFPFLATARKRLLLLHFCENEQIKKEV
jgi:hypothetical protein